MPGHEAHDVGPNGIWMTVAIGLIVTLLLGSFAYTWSVDAGAVKRDAWTQVIARLDRIERILLEERRR